MSNEELPPAEQKETDLEHASTGELLEIKQTLEAEIAVGLV